MSIRYFSSFSDTSFDTVVSGLADTLAMEGFDVIASVNLKETFKSRLNQSFRNFQLLTVCNPEIAFKAISLDSHAGLMLPCHIVVQERENGTIEISAINPMELLEENMITSSLEELSVEGSEHLRNAIDRLQITNEELLVPTA
jgi:uncharacterized protein (DUF302 family)